MKPSTAVLTLWITLSIPTVTAAAECTLPLLPDGSAVESIGEDVNANGLPLAIAEVRHPMPNSDFREHFRRLWTPDPDAPPQYVEYPLGVWQVTAHRDGDCFYTVQQRADAMALPTLAILGVGRVAAVVEDVAVPPVALPAGETLSHVRSRDQGRLADTWVLGTTQSAASLARDFEQRLAAAGWVSLMTRGNDPKTSPIGSDSQVLIFQRGAEDLGISIGPGPAGAAAVITRVVRGAW